MDPADITWGGVFFALACFSFGVMFFTALAAQCDLMDGFAAEEPKSNTGKLLQGLLAAMGHVSGLSEHCSKAWKERPMVRRKFYWAFGSLFALLLFVTLSVVSQIHDW